MPQVAFAPDVFTWPADEPRLIGGRCPACDAVAWPRPPACPRCGRPELVEELLPPDGTLVSFTTQEFFPKEPYRSDETEETFRPYGVGLVQLGDVVRVEARLTVGDWRELRIGMPVRLVVVPFRTEPDGTQVMVHAFEPAAAGT